MLISMEALVIANFVKMEGGGRDETSVINYNLGVQQEFMKRVKH